MRKLQCKYEKIAVFLKDLLKSYDVTYQKIIEDFLNLIPRLIQDLAQI
jgi:hypothetical protein